MSLLWATAWAQQPPIEAYGELPEISHLDISPDGSQYALIRRLEGRIVMPVFDAQGENIANMEFDDLIPRAVDFITDRHVIVYASDFSKLLGGIQSTHTYVFNTDTVESEPFHGHWLKVSLREYSINRMVRTADNPFEVYYSALASKNRSTYKESIFRTNLDTGRTSILERGSWTTSDIVFTNEGVALARTEFHDLSNKFQLMVNRDGEWRAIYEETTDLPTLSLIANLPDKDGVLVSLEKEDADFSSLHFIDFEGGLSEPLFETGLREPGGFLLDAGGSLIGVRYNGLKPTYEFFDPNLTNFMEQVAGLFPEDAVRLRDWSDDYTIFLFHISGGKTAPAYYLYDANTKQLGRLAPQYLRIDDVDIAPVDLFQYPARDGLAIPALLTRPKTAKVGDKLPLIVYPHGGPEAHDSLDFDYRAQYFANRGYLVFQPNFRGSDGFGAVLRSAGYGEWGGKMQDDITDGVKYLIESGWANPERICIVGASYGGYAALAGGAFTPDLYQCVAAIAPVADMKYFVRTEVRDNGKPSSTVAYLKKLLGAKMDDDEALDSISPTNAAANFKAPVLLMHGTADTVVPYSHTEKMEAALMQAGKTVRLIKLKGEDHWMSTSETRLEALEELDRFVRETIGPAQ